MLSYVVFLNKTGFSFDNIHLFLLMRSTTNNHKWPMKCEGMDPWPICKHDGASEMSVLEEDQVLEIANDSALKVCPGQLQTCQHFGFKSRQNYILHETGLRCKKKVGDRCYTWCEWTPLKVLTQLITVYSDIFRGRSLLQVEGPRGREARLCHQEKQRSPERWARAVGGISGEGNTVENLQAHESKEAMRWLKLRCHWSYMLDGRNAFL